MLQIKLEHLFLILVLVFRSHYGFFLCIFFEVIFKLQQVIDQAFFRNIENVRTIFNMVYH